MRRINIILAFCFFQSNCLLSQDSILVNDISGYFKEIKIATNQYKELWNIDLYGPILIINPFNRQVFSNYPDTGGVLKQYGSIYTGIMPKEVMIANTAVDWNGKRWAMVLLPYISKNNNERLNLFCHELFHLSQPILGFDLKSLFSKLPEEFNKKNLDNNHLDRKDGRLYLRLELNALLQAIKSKDAIEKQTHLENALKFREYRYMLFPDARLSENLQELNEGLASFTGITMSYMDELETKNYLEQSLAEFEQSPTFTNTFAYITTPLYGYLLSQKDKYWNKNININTILTDYFAAAFEISIPDDLAVAVSNISNQYNGAKINSEEIAREIVISEKIASYKTKFIELPHLIILKEAKGFSFDTRYVTPLENYGTVYQILQLSDIWGKLSVTNGALIGTDRTTVIVSQPTRTSDKKVSGDGWTIELNEGYIIEKNNTNDNYILKKK
ncbi:MAG: hypothetical protein U0T82_01285 [Bacteroidales bacterium]